MRACVSGAYRVRFVVAGVLAMRLQSLCRERLEINIFKKKLWCAENVIFNLLLFVGLVF